MKNIPTNAEFDAKVAATAADKLNRSNVAGRTEELAKQGLEFVNLNRSVVAYRVDQWRTPEEILTQYGGYTPWNLGEHATIVPPTNVPDHFRHASELPMSRILNSEAKDGVARGDDLNPLYKKIPSNPGANMGITCTALCPYGGISAVGPSNKPTYMAMIATYKGLPVTSLYQTQEMLQDKIHHLDGEAKQMSTKDKMVISFSQDADRIFTTNIQTIIEGPNFDPNTKVSIIEYNDPNTNELTNKLLVEKWDAYKMLLDSQTLECVAYTKVGDEKIYSTDGKLLTGAKIEDYTPGAPNQWVPRQEIQDLNKENLQNAILKNNAQLTDAEYNAVKGELDNKIATTIEQSAQGKSDGIYQNKHASYEFEFSDIYKGVGDIIGWVKIDIKNGTEYNITGYTPNPYFDTKAHPDVCGDKHFADVMNAANKLKTEPDKPINVKIDPNTELVTPLNKVLIIDHCPQNLIDAESVVRDKVEMKNKLQNMQAKFDKYDLTKIDGVKVYNSVDLLQIAQTEQVNKEAQASKENQVKNEPEKGFMDALVSSIQTIKETLGVSARGM